MNLINGCEYHCSLSTLLSKLYTYPNEFSGVGVSEDLYFVLQISGRLQNSANSSLSNYLSDQTIQDSWNSAQESVRTYYNFKTLHGVDYFFCSQMQCCGAVDFTDYQRIFNNLSVPLSCCNTSNPAAVMMNTTCPDIVRNGLTGNSSGLIYTNVSQ